MTVKSVIMSRNSILTKRSYVTKSDHENVLKDLELRLKEGESSKKDLEQKSPLWSKRFLFWKIKIWTKKGS